MQRRKFRIALKASNKCEIRTLNSIIKSRAEDLFEVEEVKDGDRTLYFWVKSKQRFVSIDDAYKIIAILMSAFEKVSEVGRELYGMDDESQGFVSIIEVLWRLEHDREVRR